MNPGSPGMVRRGLDQRQRGFTLVELLVVISIIGVLAAIATLSVAQFRGKGVESACRSDYKSVELAAEAYKTKFGTYPSAAQFTSGSTILGSQGLPNNPPDYAFSITGSSNSFTLTVNGTGIVGNTGPGAQPGINGCNRK